MDYFYPRSPCGERRHRLKRYLSMSLFLSTLSLRRATNGRLPGIYPIIISIHALLAESDLAGMSDKLIGSVFLSTLSLRRATWARGSRVTYVEFLSTLSLRRATNSGCPCLPEYTHFYPRSPCGERPEHWEQLMSGKHFYPRSPCGERLNEDRYGQQFWRISIHALLAESDAPSRRPYH